MGTIQRDFRSRNARVASAGLVCTLRKSADCKRRSEAAPIPATIAARSRESLRSKPCPRRGTPSALPLQNISTIAAVRIFQNPRSPMSRRHVRHRHAAMPRTLPPIELNDFGETQVGNQIRHMTRNDNCRGLPRVRNYSARSPATMAGADDRNARASPAPDRWPEDRALELRDAADRFSTNSQRAKFGSIITLCPPICTKKLEWPMKVIPAHHWRRGAACGSLHRAESRPNAAPDAQTVSHACVGRVMKRCFDHP
jgi:hypothetical protein